jgi:hypothetical protein
MAIEYSKGGYELSKTADEFSLMAFGNVAGANQISAGAAAFRLARPKFRLGPTNLLNSSP